MGSWGAPAVAVRKGDGLIRHIVSANAILVVQYAVSGLIPLLLVPHIVDVIGLAEYGRQAVLVAWGGYGAIVVQYAFQLTGPKRIAQLEPGDSPCSVFVDVTLAKILLLLGVLVLIFGILGYRGFPRTESGMAWVLLFGAPVAASVNSAWFLQVQGRFLSACVLAMIGSIIVLSVGFGFVRKQSGAAVDIVVFVSVFGQLFYGIGTLLFVYWYLECRKISLNLSRSVMAIKDGWCLFASQFVSSAYSMSGPIIINYLIDEKSAGAYSVTERAINAFMMGAMLTHAAAYPSLARAYIDDRHGYWRLLKLVIVCYLLIALMVASLGCFFLDGVSLFLYGESSFDNSILLISAFLWLVFGIFGAAYTGYLTVAGRSSEVWPLTLKILVFSIALGVPGVLLLGSGGWLAALVLSQLIVLRAGFKSWRREHDKQ